MSHTSPAPITLTKHHGLGNDFLVAVDPPRPLTSDDAAAWCDRRQGIGADGLITATPVPGSPDGTATPVPGSPESSATPQGPGDRWRMVLFNSDGGRAEISGNGLRCLAQALAAGRGHDGTTDLPLTIETDAGTRRAAVQARSPEAPAAEDRVRVGMGKAVDGPGPSDRLAELVPVTAQVGADLGNPHLVGFVDDPVDLADLDMASIGPAVERDHPGGLNVHLVRVVDRNRLEMVIWERGAGVTMACGSGACAAAWAANRAGLVGGTVEVAMPGGAARVELGDDEVVLVGPAVRVAEIRIDG